MKRSFLILCTLVLAACERVDRPNRPLPPQFYEARTLEGVVVDRAFLEGKPWVINLWVPD